MWCAFVLCLTLATVEVNFNSSIEIFILGAIIGVLYFCFLAPEKGEKFLLDEGDERRTSLTPLLLQIRFLIDLINHSDKRNKMIKLHGYMHSDIDNVVYNFDDDHSHEEMNSIFQNNEITPLSREDIRNYSSSDLIQKKHQTILLSKAQNLFNTAIHRYEKEK